jgi:hypothetical protein
VVEAFNALNRDNQRVIITDDGFTSTATDFVQYSKTLGIQYFPGITRSPRTWLPRLVRMPPARSSSRCD